MTCSVSFIKSLYVICLLWKNKPVKPLAFQRSWHQHIDINIITSLWTVPASSNFERDAEVNNNTDVLWLALRCPYCFTFRTAVLFLMLLDPGSQTYQGEEKHTSTNAIVMYWYSFERSVFTKVDHYLFVTKISKDLMNSKLQSITPPIDNFCSVNIRGTAMLLCDSE